MDAAQRVFRAIQSLSPTNLHSSEQANAWFNTIVRSEFNPTHAFPSRSHSGEGGTPSASFTPSRKLILNFPSPTRDTTLTLYSTSSPTYALSLVNPSTSDFLQSPQRAL